MVNAPLTPNEIDWAIAQLPAPLIDVDEDELLDLPDEEADDIRIANLMMTNWSL